MGYTEYVEDPTTGEQAEFTASSPGELEDKIDAHFNPPLPGPSLDDLQADITEAQAQALIDSGVINPSLSAQKAVNLIRRRAEIRAEIAQLEPIYDDSGARYAGTREGLAKIQRKLELAPAGSEERDRYRRWLAQGRGLLADEAMQRKVKQQHRRDAGETTHNRPEQQGPMEPLPLPSGSDELIQFAIDHHLVGVYKVDDLQILNNSTAVTLMHLPEGGDFDRDKLASVNASYPGVIVAGDGTNLLDVVAEVAEAKPEAVIKLLGPTLGTQLVTLLSEV